MMGENKRRYERVETNVKVMLPGDAAWTECASCNVSGGGLFFESARQQKIGDLVTLQFMLQAKTRTMSNVHFIVSAKVIEGDTSKQWISGCCRVYFEQGFERRDT